MPMIEVIAQKDRDLARGRNGRFVPRSISVLVSVVHERVEIRVDSQRKGGISPIILKLSAGNARSFSVALKGAVQDLFHLIGSKTEEAEECSDGQAMEPGEGCYEHK